VNRLSVIDHLRGRRAATLRFSRRVPLIPGLRMNFSRRGASLSIGHRGIRYAVGLRSRRLSVGLPGTGRDHE
jgi:Protein of unknown function (DUF4236)